MSFRHPDVSYLKSMIRHVKRFALQLLNVNRPSYLVPSHWIIQSMPQQTTRVYKQRVSILQCVSGSYEMEVSARSGDWKICFKVITARQHALDCDKCKRWVHRLCGTGKVWHHLYPVPWDHGQPPTWWHLLVDLSVVYGGCLPSGICSGQWRRQLWQLWSQSWRLYYGHWSSCTQKYMLGHSNTAIQLISLIHEQMQCLISVHLDIPCYPVPSWCTFFCNVQNVFVCTSAVGAVQLSNFCE